MFIQSLWLQITLTNQGVQMSKRVKCYMIAIAIIIIKEVKKTKPVVN